MNKYKSRVSLKKLTNNYNKQSIINSLAVIKFNFSSPLRNEFDILI